MIHTHQLVCNSTITVLNDQWHTCIISIAVDEDRSSSAQHHDRGALMVTASLLGLVSLLLLMIAIVAGVYISYNRLCKRDKKVIRYNNIIQ